MGKKIHVSPSDVYGYLAHAKREGYINSFERIRQGGRIYWKIEVPSVHYDDYHGIKWAPIVLMSREVCAFMEGIWAGLGKHPVNRAGAYNADWEDQHVMPHPFSHPAPEPLDDDEEDGDEIAGEDVVEIAGEAPKELNP